MEQSEKPTWTPAESEPEHEGSLWSHPYLIYVLLTVVLFFGLLGVSWLALENGWIPTR